MLGFEINRAAVCFCDPARHWLVRNRRQIEHADAVGLFDLVIGRRIGKRQRHETLLFQVGLVDAGK